ncbi:MAG: manganese efflux pump, partial [Halioglobus sp.]|nr:manganese efflux pump [Halioglobus sp.]
MIDVLILAIALSMDAFAVSIGLGSKHDKKTTSLALMSGVYFGVFQALMPMIGYLGGKGILGWVDSYASWLAFLLLSMVGGKMIYESYVEGIEEDIA